MVTVFQIILLFTIVVSFIGLIAEKDKSSQDKLLVTFLSSLAAFIASVFWL